MKGPRPRRGFPTGVRTGPFSVPNRRRQAKPIGQALFAPRVPLPDCGGVCSCADAAVTRYLVDLTLPSAGTVCQQDHVPFTGP